MDGYGYNENQGGAFYGGGDQGGGFFNQSNVYNSPATGDRPKRPMCILPTTIRQLHGAQHSQMDESQSIDGKDFTHVKVVGQILNIQEQATNVNYQIEDGTASIDARIWIDADDTNDYNHTKRHEWREGVYVSVIGALKHFNERYSLVAHRIRTITDMNEITQHFLQAIHVHLVNTRGPLGGVGGAYNNSTNNLQQNWMGDNLTELQQSIVDLCLQSPPSGLSINDICKQLSYLTGEVEIRSAVHTLTTEGHLFTTIDSEHYKCTYPSK